MWKTAFIVFKISYKNIISKIWTSRGIFWLLPNLRRNLHLFRDIIDLKVNTKKLSLGKTVLKLWSHICGKVAYLSTSLLKMNSAF